MTLLVSLHDRVQKQRATKSEDAVGHLSAQLMEKEQQVAELAGEMDAVSSRLDKMGKEKSHSYAENAALKTWVCAYSQTCVFRPASTWNSKTASVFW